MLNNSFLRKELFFILKKIKSLKMLEIELFNSNHLRYTSVNGYIQIIDRTNINFDDIKI